MLILLYWYMMTFILQGWWTFPTFIGLQYLTFTLRTKLKDRATKRLKEKGKKISWTFVPGTLTLHLIYIIIFVTFFGIGSK